MGSSGEDLIWNITSLPLQGSRHLLQAQNGDAVYFVDYKPPARDSITLPRNLLYVLAGVVLVVVATYAIVSHLVNDLMHDLAGSLVSPIKPCVFVLAINPVSENCLMSIHTSILVHCEFLTFFDEGTSNIILLCPLETLLCAVRNIPKCLKEVIEKPKQD